MTTLHEVLADQEAYRDFCEKVRLRFLAAHSDKPFTDYSAFVLFSFDDSELLKTDVAEVIELAVQQAANELCFEYKFEPTTTDDWLVEPFNKFTLAECGKGVLVFSPKLKALANSK